VDVHEESYLPFLFAGKSGDDRDIDGVSQKAAGRRVFNKKGEEVSMKVCSRYLFVGFFIESSKFPRRQNRNCRLHLRHLLRM
jgi:hypothetical protein